MENLNNFQRLMVALAMKKDDEEKVNEARGAVESEILAIHQTTGAKSFAANIGPEGRQETIGTASVVTREGTWQIIDFDAFANGGYDAGETETTLFIPAELTDAVYDALEAAGLTDKLRFNENAKEGWQERTAAIAGKLVWKATGEEVKGVEYVPGKTFVQFRPNKMADMRRKVLGAYGVTPAALLEGGRDA